MRGRAVYLSLFATTLGFTLAAATRQFAPASSIGVSAKEIGSARNVITRWQTSWGSFDRDYLATRVLIGLGHVIAAPPYRRPEGQFQHCLARRKKFSAVSFSHSPT
jgi:hypothetical protein